MAPRSDAQAASAASRATWVTMTSWASSPRPSWRTALIDTSWRANAPPTPAPTPRPSAPPRGGVYRGRAPPPRRAGRARPGLASPTRGPALHVGGRVWLRVAERLRLFQRVGEPGARGVHLVEDVVGGAVDDAEHRVHRVPGERLAQRPEQRDRPGHGRLVIQIGPGGARRVGQRHAGLGEQRLIGGPDGPPGPQP